MAALPDKNSETSKKRQVEEMFNDISPKYDLLNHLLSANIDKLWRNRVVRMLEQKQPKTIIDIATGTADFALAASRIKNSIITGIDISEGMLEVGRVKIVKNGLNDRIKLVKADSENLPFEQDSFDAAIVGFGVRNFETLKKGLSEIFRVLKPGGEFYVLEFSRPSKTPVKQFYRFYFTRILPLVGGMISKNRNAYTYLPESVNEFPDGVNFLAILAETGFTGTQYFEQTFGIATIYKACKP
ncbi:MAG: bifunctional demethylmenaquinone methyltransferase/2-methoxy-6-polyprenyl-1,4-benzoquinol methylase UbiE [Draconibacterium sp.]|jgi:demethylmenaquinone methyltransferase/2-methoxy-6-polyprenyl-1,4-benzoquinol methylase